MIRPTQNRLCVAMTTKLKTTGSSQAERSFQFARVCI